ncbi:hypothetical protein AO369_1635 [Moraxella catarrhalis]|nr:hypothetical protein AO369_1635 [Moraxella catarrhalis]
MDLSIRTGTPTGTPMIIALPWSLTGATQADKPKAVAIIRANLFIR